jgi:hypothetical protein
MPRPKTVEEHIEELRQLVKDLPSEEEIQRPNTEARLVAEADAILRALPEDYLLTLPEDLQAKIRARLERRRGVT